MKKVIIGLLALGSLSAFAGTVTSFSTVAWLKPSEDKTFTSQVSSQYIEGYGDKYYVIFSGVTCEQKAKVPAQAGGVHVRDQHIELRDGQATEIDGTLYICSSKDMPQKQKNKQQQISSTR